MPPRFSPALMGLTPRPWQGQPESDTQGGMNPAETGQGKIAQPNAGYQGPDQGPFACDHCVYFDVPRACQVVDGDIDPHGCCNNFTSNPAHMDTGGDTNEPGGRGGDGY